MLRNRFLRQPCIQKIGRCHRGGYTAPIFSIRCIRKETENDQIASPRVANLADGQNMYLSATLMQLIELNRNATKRQSPHASPIGARNAFNRRISFSAFSTKDRMLSRFDFFMLIADKTPIMIGKPNTQKAASFMLKALL